MTTNINKVERPRIVREALVRRSTQVFATDATPTMKKHLSQVKNLPERVIQDIGETKIIAFL